MTLPYAAVSALFGCFPALGLFLFYTQSVTDLLAIWGGSFLLLFLVLERKSRAQGDQKITEILDKMTHTQSQVEEKLTRLESAQSGDDASDNIVGELRLLQDLVQAMAEQKTKEHLGTTADQRGTEKESDASTFSVQVLREKTSEAQNGEVLSEEVDTEVEVQELSRERLLSIVKGALREDRIEMLLQPIVSLPQRKSRAFECYSQLRDEDGTIIIPDHYLGFQCIL